jgi:hypothetical protein
MCFFWAGLFFLMIGVCSGMLGVHDGIGKFLLFKLYFLYLFIYLFYKYVYFYIHNFLLFFSKKMFMIETIFVTA